MSVNEYENDGFDQESINDDHLFNSLHKPIPHIRGDINIVDVEQDGQQFLYFHDDMHYATSNFALNRQVAGLLSFFDGTNTVMQISEKINTNGSHIEPQQILDFVQLLDRNRVLYSDNFRYFAEIDERNFEQKSTRAPSCINSSYPADPQEITSVFDKAFSASTSPDYHHEFNKSDIKALYAPHIDLRIGMKSYAQSFALLKDLTPKRVILLGTSHYASLYPDIYANTPFIASRKTFQLPLGNVPADQAVLDDMEARQSELGISFKDRAHRVEHSLELHLILLRYLWKHSFSIVPVLVGSFDELFYKKDGYLAEKIDSLGSYLYKNFYNDDDTLILISGDMAHFGRKFGDTLPAQSMFDEVKAFDDDFLALAEQADRSGMLNHISNGNDPYRICGFPPLYSFLSGFNDLKGTSLTYNIWDETERESAVSYGSVVYHR